MNEFLKYFSSGFFFFFLWFTTDKQEGRIWGETLKALYMLIKQEQLSENFYSDP